MGLYDNSRNSGYEYFEETMAKYFLKIDVLIVKWINVTFDMCIILHNNNQITLYWDFQEIEF